MERVLTQEERIRRAEEIYLRRRNVRPQYRENNREVESNKYIPTGKGIKLFKRMALQIVICLLLYCIFYLINDTNYSFSATTISTTQEILNYDINFNDIYKYVSENIMKFINKEESINEEDNQKENTDEGNNEENISNEQDTNEVDNSNTETQEEQGKQGETNEPVEETSAVEPDLKQLYHLIRPLNGGYVSSEFGERVATSEIMSTDHKGIDIAIAERNRYYVCNGWKSNCIN